MRAKCWGFWQWSEYKSSLENRFLQDLNDWPLMTAADACNWNMSIGYRYRPSVFVFIILVSWIMTQFTARRIDWCCLKRLALSLVFPCTSTPYSLGICVANLLFHSQKRGNIGGGNVRNSGAWTIKYFICFEYVAFQFRRWRYTAETGWKWVWGMLHIFE